MQTEDIKAKGRAEKSINRDNICNIAEKLFRQKGVAKTSVNEIVREANIAKGTFYLYFKNKDDLINSIFSSYNKEFFRFVIQQNKENPKIVNISTSVLDYFVKNKLYLVELKENVHIHGKLPYYKEAISLFAKVIKEFFNPIDKFPVSQIDIYSEILVAAIFNICYKLLVEKSIASREEANTMIGDFLKRFFDCEKILYLDGK